MELIDIGLYFLYFMLGVAIIVATILPIINLFSNPKSLIRIGGGVVVLILAFVAAYSMSDGSLIPKWMAQGQTEFDLKMIGAGLIMLYIFLFGSILAMIFSEVNKLIK
jgi:hypothetical protein